MDVCTDDAYCNDGVSNICDIENSPYTTCFYCEGGECKPGEQLIILFSLSSLSNLGCVTDANCPGGYTCQDHICHYPPGKVLIESISIRTQTGCSDCSKEGVTLSLLGEKNGQYPNGVPCATRTLDHAGSTDFDGGKARFDGTLGGAEDDAEKSMMGGCYQVHLHFRVLLIFH